MRPEHWLFTIPLRLRSLFRRAQVDQELDDELLDHLERRTEEYIASGLAPGEARRRARLDLGGMENAKEECRDARGVNFIESLVRDLRYGIRMLVKTPGFTAVAVLTLALGIGANTAIFSLVDTILLRPLPYEDPGRLVVVSESVPLMGGDSEMGMAAGEYIDYRDRNRTFAGIAAYQSVGFNLTGVDTPMRVNAAAVSASAFPLLGVSPRLGRTFAAGEDRQGATPVTVLSYSFWQKNFGGDAHILGKTLKLDEKPYIVVGVMPPSFQFPFDGAPLSERADLWVPAIFPPDLIQDRLREFGVHCIARLRPGIQLRQAQADALNIANAFMEQYHYSGTIRVVPHLHRFSAYAVQKARPLVLLLSAGVACVLLIACANVANLLLARGAHRGYEMAIRSAIGAGRVRLLRQCLLESLLLSLVGAAVGFALGALMVKGARAFGPADVPRLQDATLNPAALAFTLVLSVVVTILFGLIPAWRTSQVSPQDCLKESPKSGSTRGTHGLQSIVTVAEIAIAVVLLAAGGLLLRSFVRVLNVPLGFRPDGVVVVRTLFNTARYPDAAKRESVQKELLARFSAEPGVEQAAAASHLPLSDTRQIGFRLERAAPDDFHWAENSLVSPGYFRAMGIPILNGREFVPDDRADTPLAAIISEALARQFFPGQNPIGQRFHWGDRGLFTIVGVSGDLHISALDADPPPMIYHSMFQVRSGATERSAFILSVAPARIHDPSLFAQIQQQIWSLDRDLPVYNFTTLDTLISQSVAERRFTTLLMLCFGATALALALVGLFGVTSYLVAQQRRELAIRMALGENRRGVYWMVLKRGIVLAALGCAIGLVSFPLGARLIRTMLFQTSPYDAATLFLVPLLLLAVALLASYLPARRATEVDPTVALRYE